MTFAELKRALKQAGVNPQRVTLDGRERDETYGLRQEGESWHIYSTERGLTTTIRHFTDESEACEFFLAIVLKDPNTRR